jgi:D-3-phosphoglycerate dehydrogenase
MINILITDELEQSGLDHLAAAENVQFDVKINLSKEDLINLIPQYNALIVRSGTQVDADVINAAKNLKVIGRAGIGVDNIDIRAATMNGIIVMNAPQANSIAKAEYTIALMLAVSRSIPQSHEFVKRGDWARTSFTGDQIYRKTLGLFGFGRIARLITKRVQAFGMDVIAYAPVVSEEIGREFNVTLVDLDDLLAQSDYISLHTALLPETEKIINAEHIAQMKDGVYLINTARGKLIDDSALAAGLQSGKIRAAALDVYTQEPPTTNPLIGLPNVIHTPHLGDYTKEAQRNVATQIIDQVLDALSGTDFRNAINLPYPAGPDFAFMRPYMELGAKLGMMQARLANGPIRKIEIDVRGEMGDELIRPIAAGVLKGLLENSIADAVNFINAPMLAEENGITVSRVKGIGQVDYPNLILCRVQWEDGERLLGGVLFADGEPRIVQIDDYQLEARPEGCVIVMLNKDVPGVIGQVGTLLAAYEVNIGEWRMGRQRPGDIALSFINVDSEPPAAVIDALARITAVTEVRLITL